MIEILSNQETEPGLQTCIFIFFKNYNSFFSVSSFLLFTTIFLCLFLYVLLINAMRKDVAIFLK
ncbi:hypothetical protein ASF92_17085 [Pedobacter sp. Leaf176]|nr:hypothetical protein ASF92_17085 [Pedobacter sp. Leaf176]